MIRAASTHALALFSLTAAGAPHEGPDSSLAEVQLLADGEVQDMRADMIQSQAKVFRPATGVEPSLFARLLRTEEGAAMTSEQRAEQLTPVAWFHIPKTGTSFVNTLLHTPAICPNFPTDTRINSIENSWETKKIWSEALWGPMDYACDGGFSETFREGFTTGYAHQGMSVDHYFANAGHLVTMFRQPEQRLLSDFYAMGPLNVFDPEKGQIWPYASRTPSPQEFAEVAAGGAVRQLTMNGLAPGYLMPMPSFEQVQLAVKRLEDGFAFVGITDQWDLSVCLFRTMFGGECQSSDFLNTRPTFNSSTTLYDTSVLNGWTDNIDAPLWERANELFEQGLRLYNVDEDMCVAFCADSSQRQRQQRRGGGSKPNPRAAVHGPAPAGGH
jgi:hypothetical protein